jgi:hypothetical protein
LCQFSCSAISHHRQSKKYYIEFINSENGLQGIVAMAKSIQSAPRVAKDAASRRGNSLLHILPFCEGPNEKPEGFAKQKQFAIFAMQHALQLVVHHPSLIYNVPLIIAALLRHI